MRVVVNNTTCVASGRCLRATTEVFEQGDDGFVQLILDEPPAALEKKVREAATYCPSQSISIHEDTDSSVAPG